MKRKFSIIFILMAFLMTINCLWKVKSGVAFADGKTVYIEAESKSAYLLEPFTGTVIYKKNETDKLPIASMCKIMTLLLAFEEIDNGNLSLDEEVIVSETASGMGGSQVFLEANEPYKASDLIKSITVASANDASVAIAEKICGSEQAFVEKMNDKARELGMDNTIFANCTGLPKPTQYSCAKDVATMFSELIKHKDYFLFSRIWMDEINHKNDRKTGISNTNKLIRFYDGCDSGKTGYTSEAGHCLCASAMRNGMRLVSVVISAPDSKTRFKDVSSMFNYGFANYVNKLVIDDKKPLELKVSVKGGKKDTIEIVAEKPIFLFSLKNEKRSVELEFEPIEFVKAPVNKGDLVGVLRAFEDGKEIASVNVLANESVEQATYFDYLRDVLENWAII